MQNNNKMIGIRVNAQDPVISLWGFSWIPNAKNWAFGSLSLFCEQRPISNPEFRLGQKVNNPEELIWYDRLRQPKVAQVTSNNVNNQRRIE